MTSLPRRQRKSHHKVKTGCKACKVRRRKCDEQRPLCSECIRHSTKCVYTTQNQLGASSTSAAHKAGDVMSCSRPSRALRTPPSAELNLDHLELLHQFLTSTCMYPDQLPEMTAYIQRNVLPLAQAYPFVMHGILAMAAVHLSRLRPSRAEHYTILAAKNHDRALPDFQWAMQHLNESNYSAIISYAKSILWCSFASEKPPRLPRFVLGLECDWLPQWFILLRGSCHLVEFCRPWIKDGPHFRQPLEDDSDYSECPEYKQISVLISDLQAVVEPRYYKAVLLSLRESFIRASIQHHSTPVRNAMNLWVGSLPDDYVKLLQKNEQWALAVLAHFCVLVHRFEDEWYLRGHAKPLMLAISERLEMRWKRYLEWPCAQMGIEHSKNLCL